ncbi:MAG: FecR domain-containing protein [Cytophagales bacterium]|nr:FecR domain-containing protein [Cytophagales bacterium]
MNKKNIYSIISKQLTDRSNAREDKKLESWMSESKENKAVFETLQRHWKSPNTKKYSVLRSEEIKHEVWKRANSSGEVKAGAKTSKIVYTFLKYAAAIAAVVVSVFVLRSQFETNRAEVSVPALVKKLNNAGRKSTIHLKDGSIVHLNSESEIAFYNEFSDTARVVWLKGEAFFDVTHHPARPFYVITRDLNIKVLGTSFNVNDYPDDEKVYISLSTGKVSIRKRDSIDGNGTADKINLAPGQQVHYDKSKGLFDSVSSYDPEEVEGWKDGTLYFKEAGLEDIITTLKRWYGVDIQLINNPEAEISYTGIFEKQNLENVLTSIGFVVNFDFEINEKKVIVKFKK